MFPQSTLMLSEIAEEYLECIYDLTQQGSTARTSDIAAKMKVAPASVTEMVQKLAADQYLVYEKYKGASLTDEGLLIARKIKRKHRLLERFLVDVIGVRHSQSHDEACRLEHVISDESERKICQITNNPRYCPDGDPIPECEDGDCINCPGDPAVPLKDLKAGEKGLIVYLKCEDPASIRRLISMGFVPGREVTLEEHVPFGGPLLVKIGECRVALAKEYADLVLMQRSSDQRTKTGKARN